MKIFDWLGDMFSLPQTVQATPELIKAAFGAPAYDYMAELESLLKLREGCRTTVYRDSLGKPTVGIGHLVLDSDQLEVGDVISDEFVDAFFRKDSAGALHAALLQMQEAGITDQHFIPYLTSVCFQMGVAWTAKFPNTWKMIVNGDYPRAALALNGTPWQAQTPVRVQDFQAALRLLPAKS